MANKPLNALQLQQEVEKSMNGNYNEPYEDSGSDWKEDHLEEESIHSDSSEGYSPPTNHTNKEKSHEPEDLQEEALLS